MLSIVDSLLNEILWIPAGLFFAFMVMKFLKFTSRRKTKQRGYYGGEGYLSSFPDENQDRQHQDRNHNS